MCVFSVDELRARRASIWSTSMSLARRTSMQSKYAHRLNALPHMLHMCGFSDVWMILWRQSVLACRKPLPHTCECEYRL